MAARWIWFGGAGRFTASARAAPSAARRRRTQTDSVVEKGGVEEGLEIWVEEEGQTALLLRARGGEGEWGSRVRI